MNIVWIYLIVGLILGFLAGNKDARERLFEKLRELKENSSNGGKKENDRNRK